MRTSVIVFPGSNCDRDVKVAIERITKKPVKMVWHGDASVPQSDLIVLPGGFSYGDYLRCGAMAAHSAVMRDVIAKAKAGVPVLGICNGFQILCESGLLPGVLRANHHGRFNCLEAGLVVERDSPWAGHRPVGETIRIPVKHGEGAWYVPGSVAISVPDGDSTYMASLRLPYYLVASCCMNWRTSASTSPPSAACKQHS